MLHCDHLTQFKNNFEKLILAKVIIIVLFANFCQVLNITKNLLFVFKEWRIPAQGKAVKGKSNNNLSLL
jgi:hypothetical protein